MKPDKIIARKNYSVLLFALCLLLRQNVGNRRKAESMAVARFTVSVDEDLYNRMLNIADDMSVSKSACVAMALTDWCKKMETMFIEHAKADERVKQKCN